MQDFIAELYNYAQIIPAVKEFIEYCYEDRDATVSTSWESIQDLLYDFCEKVSGIDKAKGQDIYNSFREACQIFSNGQKMFIAGDLLENVIEKLYQAIALFGNIDITDGDYRLVSSKSGLLTLQLLKTKRFLHSIHDPLWEAGRLAKRIYDYSYTSFTFCGCGLGYVPWQVFCESDSSVDIYIYHNNPKIVEYAFEYGVLSWIPEEKLHIIIEEDSLDLLNRMFMDEACDDNMGYHVFQEVSETFTNEEKEILFRFHSFNFTRTVFGNQNKINITRNIKAVQKTIYDYKAKEGCNEWIVVAAGPSLDEHIDYLRDSVGKKNIICVSTVLRKLLNKGIRPDICTVLDPQPRTWGHFEGMEDENIKLFLNANANWRFAELYNGEKYLVPSACYDLEKDYYLKNNIKMIRTGSTVSTMSIEIAIALGATKIELMGLDLSYPDNKTHASGTMDEKEIDSKHLLAIDSVDGNTVYTSKIFSIYIGEVNECIKEHPDVEFINFSEKGAKFIGAKWYRELEY